MHRRLMLLLSGEITRMGKYGIRAASLAAALMWILLIQLSGISNVGVVFPLVLFADATLMSLLLAGVTIVFELQESTLGPMLVLPISEDEYLLAKSLAITTSSLTTLAVLLIYGIAFKGLQISIPGAIAAVALIAFVFSQAGIVLAYHSKSFTDLLMSVLKFTFVFALPTILEFLGVIGGTWLRYLQYVNPMKNALMLVQATVTDVGRTDLAIAVGYTLILGGVLYAVSRKGFRSYVASKGGV